MKLGIGNDHSAYGMKLEIKQHLESLGHEVVDHGTHSVERTDYPTWGGSWPKGWRAARSRPAS